MVLASHAALVSGENRIELRLDKILLGRCSSCNVKLVGPGISRKHASIERGQGWFIKDLDSVNGTLLNDRKLPAYEIVRLRNGDKISFAPSPGNRSFYIFELVAHPPVFSSRPTSPCGLPPRPESAKSRIPCRSPSPSPTSPSPSPSFLPFVRELEAALGLEFTDQPVFRRRRRIVETILGLRTQQRQTDRATAAQSEISSLKHELQNSLTTLRSLVAQVDCVDEDAVVALIVKLKFALEEIVRRDSLAVRRWNSLVSELNAKRAELKVFKEAVEADSTHGQKGNVSTLRLKLAQEISDPHRQSAAEIVVTALETCQQEISDLRRENVSLRAKMAALKGRSAAGSDAAIEADADGRLEEVLRLRTLVAGLGISDRPQLPQLPPPRRTPAASASGAATPELREPFWGERRIADDFEQEMLQDSLIAHSENEEETRLN